MRPVRNRGGLNPAHFCSPFFTSHPRAEDGSPLTQKAYFSTCSIIDSALLPLIRGLALLLRTVQFSLLVVSDSLATPWTEAHQASLSITNSQSSLRLMSIELVMPFNYFILCRPLLLLPSIFPSIRVFSNEEGKGLFDTAWGLPPSCWAHCHEACRQLQPALSAPSSLTTTMDSRGF